MPAIKFPISVEMENGDTWDVIGDQRDLAKWEVSPFYGEGRMTTMTRYMAWSASVRQSKTDLTWPKFDAACVEVRDDQTQDDESLDPTRSGQPAGS